MNLPPRLPGVDYSAPGTYFVTFVTADRRPRLGTLTAEGIKLSRIGEAVNQAWENIGHRQPWVSTEAFCIMPDHVHGLLSWTTRPDRKAKTISDIMRGVKADATAQARRARALGKTEILWQRSFHVRIITGEPAVLQVAEYIAQNPRVAWLRRHPSR